MALHCMFDDGKPQACATCFPRPAAVHAVEPLGDARNMLWRNAWPGVAHGKNGVAVGRVAPLHGDGAPCRCVAHGIADEIGQRALQLGRHAGNIARGTQILRSRKLEHMVTLVVLRQHGRKGPTLFFTTLHQGLHRRPFGHARQGAALQARERQQIVHHALHARRLLGHHRQIPGTLFCVQLQGLQGFHKTGEHRERRADFVRDIGHEITAHGVGLLQGRDIPGQQQLAAIAIRMQVYRNAHRPRWRAVPPRQHHLVGEILGGIVSTEIGVAHQVANGLHDIALGIEPELRRRNLVTPLNAPLGVQQDNAVGRGLKRRQNFLQALIAVPDLRLVLAQQAPRPVRGLTPHAKYGRHR